MKKIGFFIVSVLLVLLVLVTLRQSDNAVEIAQAQGVIEAARAAQDAARAAQIASQGLSDVGRGQTLILVLLTFLMVLVIGFGAWMVIQRQVWKHNHMQPGSTGRWISGPNAHWKRIEGPDPYQQLLLQQEMLINQLLQQSQEDTEEDDRSQLPTGWWE